MLKKLCSFLLLLLIWQVLACTSQPDERRPNEFSLHYPFSLSVKEQNLFLSSSSVDGEFNFGKLFKIDLTNLYSNISANVAIDPKTIVESSLLIPQDISPMIHSSVLSKVIFVSRQNNYLYALKEDFVCEQGAHIDNCKDSLRLHLNKFDPYSITSKAFSNTEEALIISYLSSDDIDFVFVSENEMSLQFSLKINDIYSAVVGPFANDKWRFVARKALIEDVKGKPTIFVLFERHRTTTRELEFPSRAYLLEFNFNETISQKNFNTSEAKIYDLFDIYGISSASDLFYDDAKDELVLLSTHPGMLMKLDRKVENMLAFQTVCEGASLMSISKKARTIFLPCYADDRIASFSMDTLSLLEATKEHIKGPVMVATDDNSDKIFCSALEDKNILIFNLNLESLGSIFTKDQKGY